MVTGKQALSRSLFIFRAKALFAKVFSIQQHNLDSLRQFWRACCNHGNHKDNLHKYRSKEEKKTEAFDKRLSAVLKELKIEKATHQWCMNRIKTIELNQGNRILKAIDPAALIEER